MGYFIVKSKNVCGYIEIHWSEAKHEVYVFFWDLAKTETIESIRIAVEAGEVKQNEPNAKMKELEEKINNLNLKLEKTIKTIDHFARMIAEGAAHNPITLSTIHFKLIK